MRVRTADLKTSFWKETPPGRGVVRGEKLNVERALFIVDNPGNLLDFRTIIRYAPDERNDPVSSEEITQMKDAFRPVLKQSLSDGLAQRIKELIQTGGYAEGDRLPAIMEMARRFGVGHPTVREALKKLEATGIVEIRHGSGVYVSRSEDVLVLASPDYSGKATRKLLLDLIHARIPLEMQSVLFAARNASDEHLREMHRLMASAGENLGNDAVLNSVNMAFHRQIALASGNTVLVQLLGVLQELFTAEQRLILDIFGFRERDHREHLEICRAVEHRDEALAVELMRGHLEGVEEAIRRWNPERNPLS